MISFSVPELIHTLERIPGLQRKDWENNQTGVDRGLEAVLIQRGNRELATYTLVRMRFAAMPDLHASCAAENWSPVDVRRLVTWARTQKGGGPHLTNVVDRAGARDTTDLSLLAALASLRYYHRRDDDNPAAKVPWSNDGLGRLGRLDMVRFLAPPTSGNFWRTKLETVKRLAAHVHNTDFSCMHEEQIIQSLRSVPKVGAETAAKIALFWLERPEPVIDTYLLSLLQRHGLMESAVPVSARARRELRAHLLSGAHAMATTRPEWPAWRVLSCLYLWACEIGRLHCRCDESVDPACPGARLKAAVKMRSCTSAPAACGRRIV